MCGPVTKPLYLTESTDHPENFREAQDEKHCVGPGIKETCHLSVGWGYGSHKINLCLHLVPRIQKLPELTACSRLLIEQLKIPQKFPALNLIRKPIVFFSTARHCAIPRAS